MDRIIRQITDKLVKLLPDDHQHYELEDLRHWGFPSFIVQRIRIELERNLAESMQPPRTDWANTDSETIRNVWQQFINAIKAEARLPTSYARTVIETAVADVIEMLVQPRKNLPEVIFGSEKELGFDQLRKRMDAVVVYRHFATLIPRYMQKKELDTLSKERCKKVIVTADEKMTACYSPLNWAQMLEPLFSLLDDEIDTNLLRLFFEDKKMNRIARKFDLMDKTINRAGLIEVLSSPDSLNMEGYEEDQPELFDVKSDAPSESDIQEAVKAPAPQAGGRKQKQASADKESDDESNTETADSAEKDSEPNSEEISSSGDEVSIADNDEKAEETLNTIFAGDTEEEAVEDVDIDEDSDELNNRFTEEIEHPEDDKEEAEADDIELLEEDEETEEESSAEKADDTGQNGKEETPMWQRFMGRDDLEMFSPEEESDIEEGFIDDPVIDLTKDAENNIEKLEAMQKFLEDDRSYFVDELFRGSERAYDEALEELAGFKEWAEASKYIHENVFKRNMVDMYSEPAVDFTDRLQSHFLEQSKL